MDRIGACLAGPTLALTLWLVPSGAMPATPETPVTPATPALPATPAIADSMAQRMLACTGCHGREGRATQAGYFPRIAGKPAGYLFNQLQHFRDGRRSNPAMARLLAPLTDDYLREIAAHFAGLDLPYAPPPPLQQDAKAARIARTLIREGDTRRQLPACVQCHGEAMTGRLPAVPGLLGLSRDYLAAQLGAWRSGQRVAAEPDCMAGIARRLQPDEVAAVIDWLASQTVTASAKAAQPLPPSAQSALALPCGSGFR